MQFFSSGNFRYKVSENNRLYAKKRLSFLRSDNLFRTKTQTPKQLHRYEVKQVIARLFNLSPPEITNADPIISKQI